MKWAVLGLALCMVSGCASVPYREGVSYQDPRLPSTPLAEVQIERGKPNVVLDAADWIWPSSWLRKILLWDRRADSHTIGEETERVVHRYLDLNDLDHVLVRLNQYDPGGEFGRTVRNKSVGFGWRYTMGMLSWLRYTLLPGRLIGGDHYNPYSNTVNLYSDIPAIGVHEAGHAKDFTNRKWKGTYAFAYVLPFVNLHHEVLATNDALGYLRRAESPELQREGYRILHPAYGTYIAGNSSWVLGPGVNVYVYGGAILGGHITGRISASRIEDADDMR